MSEEKTAGRCRGKAVAILAVIGIGGTIAAMAMGVTRIDANEYGIVLDQFDTPTGVVLSEPGYHRLGLSEHLDRYTKGADVDDQEVEFGTANGSGNVVVTYRVTRQPIPYEAQPRLVAARVFGSGRMSSIVLGAARTAVGAWVKSGMTIPDTEIGKATEVNALSAISARGVDPSTVGAKTLHVTVEVLGVRNVLVPVVGAVTQH